MIYQWREDSSFHGDPQVIGEHLEQLANGDERITPHVIVSDARRQSSPLHPYFEWDDMKAAAEYRLARARQLIAAVMVIRDDVQEPVRAFINIRTEDDQSYRTLSRVLSDAELREQMLKSALAELNSIKRRYSQLEELAAIFKSIDKVKASKPRRSSATEGASRQASPA